MNWAPTNQRSRIITRENNLNLINEKMDLNLNNPLNLENPEAFTDILATGQGKIYFLIHFYILIHFCNFEFFSQMIEWNFCYNQRILSITYRKYIPEVLN